MSNTDTADPWPHVDATHLTGDLYFVNKYKPRYWFLASALCIAVPPAGMFLLAYFVFSGIHSEGDELPIYTEE